jgi:hypothetical protein
MCTPQVCQQLRSVRFQRHARALGDEGVFIDEDNSFYKDGYEAGSRRTRMPTELLSALARIPELTVFSFHCPMQRKRPCLLRSLFE